MRCMECPRFAEKGTNIACPFFEKAGIVYSNLDMGCAYNLDRILRSPNQKPECIDANNEWIEKENIDKEQMLQSILSVIDYSPARLYSRSGKFFFRSRGEITFEADPLLEAALHAPYPMAEQIKADGKQGYRITKEGLAWASDCVNCTINPHDHAKYKANSKHAHYRSRKLDLETVMSEPGLNDFQKKEILRKRADKRKFRPYKRKGIERP